MSVPSIRKSLAVAAIGGVLAVGVGFSPAASAAPIGDTNGTQTWSTQEIDGCIAFQTDKDVIVCRGFNVIGIFPKNNPRGY